MRTKMRAIAAIAAAAVISLTAGCGSDDAAGTSATSSSASAAGSEQPDAAPLTATDGWIKGVTASAKMTGAFVTLTNTSEQDLIVVSAESDLSPMTELHEMAMMDGKTVMQEIDGGIEVPAGETVRLEPGGLHVMIMNLSQDIVVGETHTIMLTLDDGSSVEFDAIVKEFAGANEEYVGGDHGGPGNAGNGQ